MPAPEVAAPPFIITYRPTEADFAAMMDAYWKMTPARVRWVYFLKALVIGSGIFFAGLAWQWRDPILATFAAMLLSAPLTAQYFNRKGYAKAFERQRIGEADVTITIDDNGIGANSPISVQHFPWTSVARVDTLKEHAFVWINRYLGIMLPAAAFGDSAAFQRAVDFARARVHGGPL